MKKLVFSGIDGEGITIDGVDKYVLLRADGFEPLVNINGLRTKEIIDYIFTIPDSLSLIGYGFGYDLENFLIDINEADYKKLTNRKTIYFPDFDCTIRFIPEKLIILKRGEDERTINNILNFFQGSFINALKSFGLEHMVNETIIEGKANRGNFTKEKLDEIIEYNRQEIAALTALMTTFYNYAIEAFEKAEIPLEFNEFMLMSPGKLAQQLMEKTNWVEEHPQYEIPYSALSDWEESLKDLHTYSTSPATPFLASYFGGRIEAGALGKWDKTYMADINSAYPKADAILPKFNKDDFIYSNDPKIIQNAMVKRYIGQYYIEWHFPEGWDYYPFPYRLKTGVIFPREGKGWIMSPEIFAAIDSGATQFKVTRVIYLKHTATYGDGHAVKNESTTGKFINRIYNKRLEFKREKNGAEKPLKLVLNSLYGKTFEQSGATFSDLAGSWITSFTRSMLWRAIAPHKTGHKILQMMTDSVFSTVKLDLNYGTELGQWGSEEYYNFRLFLPGIYDWNTKDGTYKQKIRGHSKSIDLDEAWKRLTGKIDMYAYPYSQFIGHLQSYNQTHKYGDKMLQWIRTTKEYKPSLSSKREDTKTGSIIPLGSTYKWCKPMLNKEAGKLSQQSLEQWVD